MSDALVRLHEVAKGLLTQVDEILTRFGAPPSHPIWPLLRSRGLLPADAVGDLMAWSPQALRAGGELMSRQWQAVGASANGLRVPAGWEGSAAQAAAVRLDAARRDHETFGANAQTLAGCHAELADLFADARVRLAHTLARVMSSRQAITLVVGSEEEQLELAVAAADIGAELLGEIDRCWVAVLDLARDRLGSIESGDARRDEVVSTDETVRVEF